MSEDGYVSNKIVKVVYDTVKPQITFDKTPAAYENEAPSAIIKFMPSEDIYADIKINGQAVFENIYCPSLQDKEFVLPLVEGSNVILLTVRDRAGNTVEYQWKTIYEYMIKEISFVDDDENQITALIPNTTINVLAKAENKLNVEKDVAIIIVYYNNQNQMIAYGISYDTVLPSSTEELLAGLQLPSSISEIRVKAFIWNSVEGMIPLSSAIEIK